MRIIPLSAAFALALPASIAMSQQYDVDGMTEGLSMIELNAVNGFKAYKIDADPTALTVAQLARIIGILNDLDGNSVGRTYKASIEATLRNSQLAFASYTAIAGRNLEGFGQLSVCQFWDRIILPSAQDFYVS